MDTDLITLGLAIWGAALSTYLAYLRHKEGVERRKEKSKADFTAEIIPGSANILRIRNNGPSKAWNIMLTLDGEPLLQHRAILNETNENVQEVDSGTTLEYPMFHTTGNV